MDNLIMLVVCSMVVQFCTERIKIVISEANRSEFTPFIALAIGVGVAFTTRMGLFNAFGLDVQPLWADWLITGVAYSGGAVAFNEWIKLLSEKRPSNQGM